MRAAAPWQDAEYWAAVHATVSSAPTPSADLLADVRSIVLPDEGPLRALVSADAA